VGPWFCTVRLFLFVLGWRGVGVGGGGGGGGGGGSFFGTDFRVVPLAARGCVWPQLGLGRAPGALLRGVVKALLGRC